MTGTPPRSNRTPAADPEGGPGIVDALAQLSFLIQSTLARNAAAHDLSITQTRLLGLLRDREPGMNELARLLDLDKSSVTGLINRAARRGLVERMPSVEDRRAAHVRLTDAGRAVVAEVAATFGTDVARIISPLRDDERAALSTLITQVLVAHATARGLTILDMLPSKHPKS